MKLFGPGIPLVIMLMLSACSSTPTYSPAIHEEVLDRCGSYYANEIHGVMRIGVVITEEFYDNYGKVVAAFCRCNGYHVSREYDGEAWKKDTQEKKAVLVGEIVGNRCSAEWAAIRDEFHKIGQLVKQQTQ